MRSSFSDRINSAASPSHDFAEGQAKLPSITGRPGTLLRAATGHQEEQRRSLGEQM
jgi:hypothetical protein